MRLALQKSAYTRKCDFVFFVFFMKKDRTFSLACCFGAADNGPRLDVESIVDPKSLQASTRYPTCIGIIIFVSKQIRAATIMYQWNRVEIFWIVDMKLTIVVNIFEVVFERSWLWKMPDYLVWWRRWPHLSATLFYNCDLRSVTRTRVWRRRANISRT